MTVRLTKLQKHLCNILQQGLPICARPFDKIAESLNTSEEQVLQQVGQLQQIGIIQRISALINHRALGKTSTLIAAHIPESNIDGVVRAVNLLDNVSHNYLRQHHYNLWFTLQADLPEQIEIILSNLSARFDIEFHNLPVRRIFKLDVRFDADSSGQLSGDVKPLPKTEPVELNQSRRLILSKLQNDIEPVARPFDLLTSRALGEEDILRIITELIDEGLIRRIAAVVDHYRLGITANVLFACKVAQDKVIEAGSALARFGIVSHCYERQIVKDWPYNLFAMMHSRSIGEIQHTIDRFVKGRRISSFELLPTAAELKKQPVKHRF